MECIRITKETLQWFEQLLEPPYPEQIARGEVYAAGAVADGTACGVLVFRLTDLLIDIEYIAVSDGYRRQGVGTAMLQFLCEHADKSVSPITCSFAASGKTDPLCLFFAEQENFTVNEEDGFICETAIAALGSIELPKVKSTLPAAPFFSLPESDRRIFWLNLKQAGRLYGDELKAEECVAPLCLCVQSRDGIKAAVFVQAAADDGLMLSFAWCAEGAQASLVYLFGELIAAIAETGKTGKLTVAAVTPESAALTEKLLPNHEITARFYTAVWDMITIGG
ncbi:MAG: GNAT family N-acetyltransferase [Oscillospiraceae bacterium]|nr:GNAT family N-acetyltransferase [Oscillospiraceae bacterium]